MGKNTINLEFDHHLLMTPMPFAIDSKAGKSLDMTTIYDKIMLTVDMYGIGGNGDLNYNNTGHGITHWILGHLLSLDYPWFTTLTEDPTPVTGACCFPGKTPCAAVLSQLG